MVACFPPPQFFFFWGGGRGVVVAGARGASAYDRIINKLTKLTVWPLKEKKKERKTCRRHLFCNVFTHKSCTHVYSQSDKLFHKHYLEPKPCIRRNDIVENFHNLFVWHAVRIILPASWFHHSIIKTGFTGGNESNVPLQKTQTKKLWTYYFGLTPVSSLPRLRTNFVIQIYCTKSKCHLGGGGGTNKCVCVCVCVVRERERERD